MAGSVSLFVLNAVTTTTSSALLLVYNVILNCLID
jgi:hypothetical protein